uniref:Uncharacterized protein n=1 Tax=Physcomitrium patens TaxID=3218 RepID=A0A2K1KP59_PHYPA|nr:hypothetical protein PHYPA_006438 [Physcomitrium patens]
MYIPLHSYSNLLVSHPLLQFPPFPTLYITKAPPFPTLSTPSPRLGWAGRTPTVLGSLFIHIHCTMPGSSPYLRQVPSSPSSSVYLFHCYDRTRNQDPITPCLTPPSPPLPSPPPPIPRRSRRPPRPPPRPLRPSSPPAPTPRPSPPPPPRAPPPRRRRSSCTAPTAPADCSRPATRSSMNHPPTPHPRSPHRALLPTSPPTVPTAAFPNPSVFRCSRLSPLSSPSAPAHPPRPVTSPTRNPHTHLTPHSPRLHP